MQAVLTEPQAIRQNVRNSPFVFQQDNAPSHASRWTLRRLAQEGIEVLEHIGNSPDMNAIEGAWMPMRIAITQD